MKGTDGLQKVLYLIMAALAVYIVYKGGSLLLETPAVQRELDGGIIQRALEDSAVTTWAPGYAAGVTQQNGENIIADWMEQVAPVYSYLADGIETESETDETTGNERMEANAGGTGTGGTDETTEPGEAIETAGAGGTDETTEPGQTDGQAPETDADNDAGDGQENTEEQTETEETEEAAAPASAPVVSASLLNKLRDFNYLLSNYYTVDGGTVADEELLDADALLAENLTLEKNPQVPQILIYHTHSQEAFADSREGETEDTIIGMGEVLAEELRQTYGYNVIHDTGVYDLVDGVLDRSAAYDYARASITQILEENPTIEVVIDLHRDGVEGQKFVTEIDGRPTSMIMFFNGISRDSQDEPITYLQNPYTTQNLAFSLQLQLAAREKYPGFTRNIYLKAERFNLHLRPRSLLVEAGTQLNTVEEERNAMIPLAELLNQVLAGNGGVTIHSHPPTCALVAPEALQSRSLRS